MTDDLIRVWRVRSDLSDARLPQLLSDLTPKEHAHAARFRFARDRIRYIAAHAALRRILAAALGIRPVEVTIEEGHGKPHLAPVHRSPLQFNLSHSADTALVALHPNAPVGIDVEAVRLPPQFLSIAARYFGQSAVDLLERVPDFERGRAFMRLWVRFEAMMKAQGTGIVSGTPLPDALISSSSAIIEAGGWTVYDIDVARNEAAALACAGRPREIAFSEFAL